MTETDTLTDTLTDQIRTAYEHHNRAPLQIALDMNISLRRVCRALGLQEYGGYICRTNRKNNAYLLGDKVLSLIRAGASNGRISKEFHINYHTVCILHEEFAEMGLCKPAVLPAKAVIKMDSAGHEIARYKSITDGAKSVGLARASIQKCLQGHAKTSGGYCWKYVEETS